MSKQFRSDLHIHTCLSPCGDIDMSPLSVVTHAVEKKLDIIAVTDHNSAENTVAAIKSAELSGIKVMAGMEITSLEEAHILALFDDPEGIVKMQDIVYRNLAEETNDDRLFGEQIVVNEKDEVLGFNKRLLIGSTQLTALSIVNEIHNCGGLAVASHIDRDAFSIISQLGFIPGDLSFDALEISSSLSRENAREQFSDYTSFPWISSSDAHTPDDIGKRVTIFHMQEATVQEMRMALKGIDGRKVEWE